MENRSNPEKNRKVLNDFSGGLKIIPIFNSLDFYAKEKARLQRKGKRIDDFDLLIGSTAVVNDLILVTNNKNHFDRISRIKVENWAEK